VAHFEGTPHVTRTCPRRTLLQNPDVVAVFDLRHELGEGGLGVAGAAHVTPAAIEGLAVVDDGVAYRTKTLDEERAISGAMAAAAQAVRDGG